jgi:formylglycine-generating enzyme required for sulfatase activity
MKRAMIAILAGCSANSGGSSRAPGAPGDGEARDPAADLVAIDGATFTRGSAWGVDRGRADEAPQVERVDGFEIMRFEVTNDQFAAFVTATGHRTHPETRGRGWTWDGSWHETPGADWRHPLGPGSSIGGRGDHPVVQVSVVDAAAFCAHHGLRLPTDPEWELAARGTDGRRYPWGNDAPTQKDRPRRANFGTVDCCAASDADGYRTTAPVGSFPAGVSPHGLHDMAGNVWEWTADPFDGPGKVALRGGGWGNNPFCLRTTYRHANDRDVGRDHIGFRCAR